MVHRNTLPAFILLFAISTALANPFDFPRGEFPLTDFDTRSVESEEILSGGPPRDGIPPIDKPSFVDASAANVWLDDKEPVIALPGERASRLVTLSRLAEEPVLNLNVDGTPMAVFAATQTLSALDQASIANSRAIPAAAGFDARIDGTALTFIADSGDSKEPLVVHDEQTGSRWDAFGRAVDGELEGRALTPIDLGVHFAFAWFAFDVEAEVLARQ